jgi:hypothetical protein
VITPDALKTAIDSALAADVEVRPVREGQVQVYVPFEFPDGDGLVVHVREGGDGRLEVTDVGHTLLHLSYHTELKRFAGGPRAELLEKIQLRHDIEDRDGEFVLRSSRDAVGVDVFRFSQALLEVSDLRNLDREIVRSTFRDDFARLIAEHFPEAQRDYVDREHDPKGEYPVPFVLNGTARPIGVFDVNSDERALEAVVIAGKLQSWGHRMHLVAVEENQESLTRKHVAWLSATLDKQFPTLEGSEREIVEHLTEQHQLSLQLGTKFTIRLRPPESDEDERP